MTARNRKSIYVIIFLGSLLLYSGASSVIAANISEFINLTPYIEVEGVYDDNIFELSDDAPLPEDSDKREDFVFNTSAGLGVEIALERPYLTLGVEVDYRFEYSKYAENDEFDDIQNNLNFDFNFASKYERGVVRDRLRFDVKDVLSLVPIDEDEPLFPGNRVVRNNLEAGIEYKLISTQRIALTLGYSYNRIDFDDDDPIEVATITGYENSADLTQESQTHSGKADLMFHLNPKLTYVLTYTFSYADREENEDELVSANFARHTILSGIRTQLTPRIQANIQAGYGLTTYEDVGDLGQDDQSDVIVETSLDANFAHHPLMTVGYRRYYTENDFGDTLLTDNVFGRIGLKIVRGFIVYFSGDYIVEARELLDDETTQIILGVNTEYELLKNLLLLASYDYKNKDFFEHNFLVEGEREETTHIFSTGFQYKIGRYVLLKGIYSYTDKTSDIPDQEFSRNKFTATGKVIF